MTQKGKFHVTEIACHDTAVPTTHVHQTQLLLADCPQFPHTQRERDKDMCTQRNLTDLDLQDLLALDAQSHLQVEIHVTQHNFPPFPLPTDLQGPI